MSQASLTYHIVLATRRRRRFITADVRGRLRRYLAGMIKKLRGHPFTVSQFVVGKVVAYVNAQQEHHRARPFEEELKDLLDRHGIEYDPRYV